MIEFVLYSCFILFSLAMGSFISLVTYRLPLLLEYQANRDAITFLRLLNYPLPIKPASLYKPRSYCPHCKTSLQFWHNIPLLSFCFLKGKCGFCKKPISWFYPGIECVTLICSILVLMQQGFSVYLWPSLLFTYILITLSSIDIYCQYLPDSITLMGLWLGLLCNSVALFISPAQAIWGTAAGYSILWMFNSLYFIWRQKQGMGQGDFKLFALLGAWLGYMYLPLVLFIAAALGSFIGLFLILKKKNTAQDPLPFGPYLALAGWVCFIYKPFINPYFSLYRMYFY